MKPIQGQLTEEFTEPKIYPYKHRRKVTIILESNNFPKMQEMASKYYFTKPTKVENDPKDLENFVSISAVQEDWN